MEIKPLFGGSDAQNAGNVGFTFASTLLDQWARIGVRHAVISPGSRSTPLAVAAAQHPDITVHVHHDERSASFMALGIGLSSRVPAVLICTSGTAAAEFHPAVIEANYANVPMIVCTADRPPELQGVGAPQTIDQRRLYGDAVRWFVEPGPANDEYRSMWRHLANDAFLAASGLPVGRPPGPVHCNLAFREPLLGELDPLPEPIELPPRAEASWGLIDEELAALVRICSGARGVIVCGDRSALSDHDRDAIVRLAEVAGWPVFADHQSRLRDASTGTESVVLGADALARVDAVTARLRPEVVVRVGGVLTSKTVNTWLASCGGQQIGIDRWGTIPDPDQVLERRLTAHPQTIARHLAAHLRQPAPQEWTELWRQLSTVAKEKLDDVVDGEIGTARAVLDALSPRDEETNWLVVSSSMPIRDIEWYGGSASGVRVLSNRGANGIDGVTSTALGVALETGRPTACLIGDVAFLHDTNAMIAMAHRSAPLCVVVIDNDGGGIFSFLSQHEALDAEQFEQLFGTPHGADLLALARAHGLETVDVGSSVHELRDVVDEFSARPRPMVVRVVSDRDTNLAEHRALNAAIAVAASGVIATAG